MNFCGVCIAWISGCYGKGGERKIIEDERIGLEPDDK